MQPKTQHVESRGEPENQTEPDRGSETRALMPVLADAISQLHTRSRVPGLALTMSRVLTAQKRMCSLEEGDMPAGKSHSSGSPARSHILRMERPCLLIPEPLLGVVLLTGTLEG